MKKIGDETTDGWMTMMKSLFERSRKEYLELKPKYQLSFILDKAIKRGRKERRKIGIID
jgi:hypothetical protein